jgi:hypothetical protein
MKVRTPLDSIRSVAVLVALDDGQSRTRAFETLDTSHDVDHGFGGKVQYGRAPDVFNRTRYQPLADRIDKKPDDLAPAISSVEVATRQTGEGDVEHVSKVRLWDKNAALKLLFQLRGHGAIRETNVNLKADVASSCSVMGWRSGTFRSRRSSTPNTSGAGSRSGSSRLANCSGGAESA